MKETEWSLLNENFGKELEEDVNKIPRGENIINLLKDKGLDKREDKAGWTVALLFNLGMGFVGNAEETASTEFSDKFI